MPQILDPNVKYVCCDCEDCNGALVPVKTERNHCYRPLRTKRNQAPAETQVVRDSREALELRFAARSSKKRKRMQSEVCTNLAKTA